jgi:hypothetical protein
MVWETDFLWEFYHQLLMECTMILKSRQRRRFLVGISAGLPALCGSAFSASRREVSADPSQRRLPNASAQGIRSEPHSAFLDFRYHSHLRPSPAVIAAVGRITTFTYDPASPPKPWTITTFTYDPSSPPQVCDAPLSRTTYVYDPATWRPSLAQPFRTVTTYSYDGRTFTPQPPGLLPSEEDESTF